ncbi:MAG: hypothetical protein ACP6IS_06040 [Candidatus Asgardarchaeia archaeon]
MSENQEIVIQGKGIKRAQVAKLKDFLSKKFPKDVAEIKRSGKEIKIKVINSNKVSKTKLRPYLKRFIHMEGLSNEVKVLSIGKEGLLLHRKGGIEPVEEEETTATESESE